MKKSYQNKDNFLQWFVGFSDAESNFSVVPHKDGTIKKKNLLLDLLLDCIQMMKIL